MQKRINLDKIPFEYDSGSSLLDFQKVSYENFFKKNDDLEGFYKNISMETILKSVFPVNDTFGLLSIEYLSHRMTPPKYSESECIDRGFTYSSSLYITLRMFHYEIDESTGVSDIASIKEQEVHLCDIPLMSSNVGSFILNGVQKVIVSQICRSPGIFFEQDIQKNSSSYSASIIPYKGSWIDFEFDTKGTLYFRINRRKKMHAAYILSAFGIEKNEIIDIFLKSFTLECHNGIIRTHTQNLDRNVSLDLSDINGNSISLTSYKKTYNRDNQDPYLYVHPKNLIGLILRHPVTVDGLTIDAGTHLTQNIIDIFVNKNITFSLVDEANSFDSSIITYVGKHIESPQKSMKSIVKSVRTGISIRDEDVLYSFERLFLNPNFYDLSIVGRYKINLEFSTNIDTSVLTMDDVKNVISKLLHLKFHNLPIQDLDALKNRRVRGVGELFSNVFEKALVKKLAKVCSEKMNSSNPESLTPSDVISTSIISSDVKDFFLLSQLSQFADQTNPLAEIVHKRRISALGPGGLNRDRAGFEVRDVHYSHYGRLCPIETPEGANIGLINTLALYAKVNDYGFITTPYKKVINGVITDEVEYIDSIQEYDKKIAEYDDEFVNFNTNSFYDKLIRCRINGDFQMVQPNHIDYIGVNPKQIISVASSLVPFIESNDASRALMGANMQRQAVPLLNPQSPIVGTGMESKVIADTMSTIFARNDGIVVQINDDFIAVQTHNIHTPCEIYQINKFRRTNQSTCYNHSICVSLGQKIHKGDILATGSSVDRGELAIGQNLLTAFTSWNGYNFEDAIVISEKVAKSDVFTSVHIEEFEVLVRDTRLGSEEITRDIPNVPSNILTKLDESGVVNIGAFVQPGDILVGKVSPKSEDVLTAEEKLLKAIFGERNSRVRNTSLIVPPGISGTVIDVKIFTKNGVNKIERAKELDDAAIAKIKEEFEIKNTILETSFNAIINNILFQTVVVSTGKTKNINKKFAHEELLQVPLKDKLKFVVDDEGIQKQIIDIKNQYSDILEQNKNDAQIQINNVLNGNDLQSGVLMSVKVYVAIKRKIQPGDKMAGRHGNKGVVSVVLPVEDMPFLEDGTPVDIVLNPLGVANRMNIGQILEVHLGMASRFVGMRINEMLLQGQTRDKIENVLFGAFPDSIDTSIKNLSDTDFTNTIKSWSSGVKVSTSSFQSITDSDISKIFESLGVNKTGKFPLYDGLTGEKFDRDVVVGVMYMLKLHHLVEAKIHARSVGPYSLVTQQPLGGRSYFGGQRVGEMECWALQAYGAAYTLQEMLTVKSDDIHGRSEMYTSIVRGDYTFKYGIPESCNVMLKELRSLCLNVELEYMNNTSVE